MNIVICDDRESDAMAAKEVIKRTAHELHIKAEFDIYSNAADVERKLLINKEPADILILDIDMPKISGLELAERIRAENLDMIIIFLSAHEEFVFKAIEFQPFRYIRKIRLETEMPIAIQAAVNVLEISSDKQIILYTEDGEKAVMISEIMYLEAEKHKTYIYLKNGGCIHARRSIAELHQLISISNKCTKNNVSFETTKKDKKLHGIGLHSVKHTVKYYNGEFSVKHKNNVFIVNVMLPT